MHSSRLQDLGEGGVVVLHVLTPIYFAMVESTPLPACMRVPTARLKSNALVTRDETD